MPNAFQDIYRQRIQESTKAFLARGILVKRCEHCLLSERWCICPWLRPYETKNNEQLDFDFVLIMHRDEILKPTNTGRLITEVFPRNCFIFEWSRLAPNSQLLDLVQDPRRLCAILFPTAKLRKSIEIQRFNLGTKVLESPPVQRLRPTFILLDGTWRQAARMFNLSQWLYQVPSLTLDNIPNGRYAVRKAISNDRLSTAEAAAVLMENCGQLDAANHLQHVFNVFNDHYKAARMCTEINSGLSHAFLLKNSLDSPV
jgi:DTW domain-containing protein YfiP